MPISTIDQKGLNAPLTLTNPVLTTPNLGTPSALVLTNATALPKAALPTGSVLQVVNSVFNSTFTTSSTSYVDTGFTATITPTSATSRILILFNSGGLSRPAVANECLRLQIVRGSSTYVYGGGNIYFTTSNFDYSDWYLFLNWVDSPATSSSITYKIQMQTRLGNSCSMNNSSGGQQASIQLLEIAS